MRATLCLVSGFLGAGKTTTLLAAARELRRRGHRPAVVTNDQGHDLVDSRLARTVVDAVGEVVDGCFCCRFDQLADVVTDLVAGGADVVLAEAVGSCTDLRATVVRPLRAYHGDLVAVAPLVTVVDPMRYRSFARDWARGQESDFGYLYAHQLAEADVIAVNKMDLIGPAVAPLLAGLARHNPAARIVPYSAWSGDVTDLVDVWCQDGDGPDRPDTALDYDRYAAAEAGLAWLNHEVVLTAPGGFPPARWATAALTSVSHACAEQRLLVGHAKVALRTASGGLVKASVTVAGKAPSLDLCVAGETTSCQAVFNLRLACSPDQMNRMCSQAVAAADQTCGTSSTASAGPSAFRPSYPRPTHRMAVDDRSRRAGRTAGT
jgi:G3E family GTPase